MTATAKAATPLRLAVIEIDQVLKLCDGDPSFGSAFYRQVALLLETGGGLEPVRARIRDILDQAAKMPPRRS